MIRSVKHHLKNNTNPGKLETLSEFLDECRVAAQLYIDYYWDVVIFDKDNSELVIWDIKNDKLDLPKYLDYKCITFETKLSARALSSIITQVSGMLRSCVGLRKNILNKIAYCNNHGYNTDKLEKKLLEIKLSKPILKDNFSLEISSKNIDYEDDSKYFDSFIRLSSIGKFGHIKLPIKNNKRDKHWLKQNGIRMNSILISKTVLQIRYEIPDVIKSIKTNKTVGGDTGFNNILTLSDKQVTPQINNHNQSFKSICNKLVRKEKGSKAYKRTQDQRTNFINWSINQLNFNSFDKINLEKIDNIFYKNKTSALMNRFVHAEIERKILSKAEEAGVQVVLQTSAYYSQRCSCCGYVLDKNRKGKEFCYKSCGFKSDADLNAAINHENELPKVPNLVKQTKLNRSSGFFWKLDGIFDKFGQELGVSDN